MNFSTLPVLFALRGASMVTEYAVSKSKRSSI
jgi:hypothetical protein